MKQYSTQMNVQAIAMENGYYEGNQAYSSFKQAQALKQPTLDDIRDSVLFDDCSTQCGSMKDLQAEFQDCLEISPQSQYKVQKHLSQKLDHFRRHSDKPNSQFEFFESKEEEQEMLNRTRGRQRTIQPTVPDLFFLEEDGFDGMSIELA